ncbi:hypothetical protein B0H67DRAFT_565256 [Lasiosphaeris hirsuta]|uniref:Uncharacterized protein n=1 Tax=Lasiosphaeris hirsuta TaxID=260670 RepID=A0AA40EDQ8_9PEZI|nr:hypothetical protein B0H67DRAFT_565256 [Lasiosphaeris hirsuta]
MFSSPAALLHLLVTLTLTTLCLAAPYHMQQRVIVPYSHYEVLKMRASTSVNPRAITDTTCIDPKAHIVFHDQNVAELAICGGIAGAITKCSGPPVSATVGRSGSALFSLMTLQEGATITLSKQRWEQCVRAARAVCPTGSLAATCRGGASSGDVAFSLTAGP